MAHARALPLRPALLRSRFRSRSTSTTRRLARLPFRAVPVPTAGQGYGSSGEARRPRSRRSALDDAAPNRPCGGSLFSENVRSTRGGFPVCPSGVQCGPPTYLCLCFGGPWYWTGLGPVLASDGRRKALADVGRAGSRHIFLKSSTGRALNGALDRVGYGPPFPLPFPAKGPVWEYIRYVHH